METTLLELFETYENADFVTSIMDKMVLRNEIKRTETTLRNGNFQEAYGTPLGDTIMENYTPLIEDVVGEPLFPTYSMLRIYTEGETLAPHTDRSECEISASVLLCGDERWLFRVGNRDFFQRICEAVVYEGTKLTHSRPEPLKGMYQHQLLMHWVRQSSEDSELKKFDHRPCLGMEEWTRLRVPS